MDRLEMDKMIEASIVSHYFDRIVKSSTKSHDDQRSSSEGNYDIIEEVYKEVNDRARRAYNAHSWKYNVHISHEDIKETLRPWFLYQGRLCKMGCKDGCCPALKGKL